MIFFFQSVFTADVTATDGEDYIEHNGQLIFQPGDSLKSVNITIIQDGIAEGEESFVANLTLIDNTGPSAALGQSTLTVIIDDDEAPPTVPPTPGM